MIIVRHRPRYTVNTTREVGISRRERVFPDLKDGTTLKEIRAMRHWLDLPFGTREE
jgi:hypothetical protein